MNRKTQDKQLDFHICFWQNGMVTLLCVKFLGHAKSKDLLAAFTTCTEILPRRELIQLSMEGPSVNWKFCKEA